MARNVRDAGGTTVGCAVCVTPGTAVGVTVGVAVSLCDRLLVHGYDTLPMTAFTLCKIYRGRPCCEDAERGIGNPKGSARGGANREVGRTRPERGAPRTGDCRGVMHGPSGAMNAQSLILASSARRVFNGVVAGSPTMTST